MEMLTWVVEHLGSINTVIALLLLLDLWANTHRHFGEWLKHRERMEALKYGYLSGSLQTILVVKKDDDEDHTAENGEYEYSRSL